MQSRGATNGWDAVPLRILMMTLGSTPDNLLIPFAARTIELLALDLRPNAYDVASAGSLVLSEMIQTNLSGTRVLVD